MNNTMTISDGIKKSIVKDYETKLFKMYDRILKDKEKLFKDKDFQLVLFKQRYDTKLNKWIYDTDENFEKVKNSNPESTTKVSDIKVNGDGSVEWIATAASGGAIDTSTVMKNNRIEVKNE